MREWLGILPPPPSPSASKRNGRETRIHHIKVKDVDLYNNSGKERCKKEKVVGQRENQGKRERERGCTKRLLEWRRLEGSLKRRRKKKFRRHKFIFWQGSVRQKILRSLSFSSLSTQERDSPIPPRKSSHRFNYS